VLIFEHLYIIYSIHLKSSHFLKVFVIIVSIKEKFSKLDDTIIEDYVEGTGAYGTRNLLAS
jgi:hypothetical protein